MITLLVTILRFNASEQCMFGYKDYLQTIGLKYLQCPQLFIPGPGLSCSFLGSDFLAMAGHARVGEHSLVYVGVHALACIGLPPWHWACTYPFNQIS